jgi:hypothetical protein
MTMRALFRLSTPLLLLLPLTVHADDLTGADRLICATVKATECYADGTCTQGEPETWNIPRFIRVDLGNKTLSTTQASGEKRTTPLGSLVAENDRIFIQGSQTGRAVSMVINQRTGIASAGIVLDGHVLTVFAHCTPLDSQD